MKTDGSDGDRSPSPTSTPGSIPGTASDGYQNASERPALSEQSPAPGPEIGGSSDDEGERIDPFEAFARAAAKVAAERGSEKERRNPATWLPGPDDLDQELGPPDRETRFSRDSWTRGNPQVSVRLRPLDFDRLRRAADLYGVRPTTLARMMVIRGTRAILDADLRKAGDEFRDRRRG